MLEIEQRVRSKKPFARVAEMADSLLACPTSSLWGGTPSCPRCGQLLPLTERMSTPGKWRAWRGEARACHVRVSFEGLYKGVSDYDKYDKLHNVYILDMMHCNSQGASRNKIAFFCKSLCF